MMLPPPCFGSGDELYLGCRQIHLLTQIIQTDRCTSFRLYSFLCSLVLFYGLERFGLMGMGTGNNILVEQVQLLVDIKQRKPPEEIEMAQTFLERPFMLEDQSSF